MSQNSQFLKNGGFKGFLKTMLDLQGFSCMLQIMTDLRIETVQIDSLQFDPTNARKHDAKNLDAIAGSLRLFGQRKPIIVTPDNIVVAGNGTLEAAQKLGWTEIAISRTPIGWTWDQIKAYALADNRTAELAEWNAEVLKEQMLELDAVGWELQEFGFVELQPPLGNPDDHENLYTSSINIPQYEIVGEQPTTESLVNESKTKFLQKQIYAKNLSNKDIEQFLILGTYRHLVFNYKLIAEYYAHCDKETQELMEQSALVIIDMADAIANGYVKFMETIELLEKQDG
jgi:hypothetical protein